MRIKKYCQEKQGVCMTTKSHPPHLNLKKIIITYVNAHGAVFPAMPMPSFNATKKRNNVHITMD